ncbi:sulfatase-like hydrolase/transferase [Pseudomonas japonica]|uniref:Sulfatase n=1 Tax=Pseudomonas japonica TaxID=256466 RepID=A0A239F9Q6_9PSED|nr:sulfatase-like hydrolase/transferase [Pseudomonas japonica]SNS53535.1 Sulfatase [Pseudomonas japonica]
MNIRTFNTPLWKRAALSFCTAASIFLWVPLYVVYLSIDDINFNIHEFFVSALLITAAASLLFFVCASLLALLRLGRVGSFALYFMLFWSSLAGFMLPLVRQGGMVSPEDLATDSLNLALVAGASFLLALLTFTRLKGALQVFLLILTASTLGGALPSLTASDASPERFTGLSSTDNLLVLSFDGLAGNAARQVLEEDPELKQQLRDFIFFDNAISTAPATWASIRSELYGNLNFREFKNSSGKPRPFPPGHKNYLQREQANGADVVTYGAYSAFNDRKEDRIRPLTLGRNSFAERAVTSFDLYPYIAARIGTALAARFVDESVKTMLPAHALTPTSRRALEHQGAKWDALNTLQSNDLMTFIDGMHVAGERRSVRYLHLLHTHFPVDLDENCSYRSADAQWFNDNQNYRGVLNETHCALRQTARLIEKLKALGVYDKTLFVVKSDHGVPVSYMNDTPDDYKINNHPMWGYNRYRPLLMIKAQAHKADTLTYNSTLASLSDLPRTLCLQVAGKQSCKDFDGMDILNSRIESVFIDVVVDEHSGFTTTTHTTVEVPRIADFPTALRSTGEVRLTNEMDVFNQRKIDLTELKGALEAYYKVNGKYPLSQGFDGLHSTFGKDTADYVAGLVPDFIPRLPLDPAQSTEPMPQYIYLSNGNDYKLIAHGHTRSCTYAKRLSPELVDPARDCWGFGYWSEGARTW